MDVCLEEEDTFARRINKCLGEQVERIGGGSSPEANVANVDGKDMRILIFAQRSTVPVGFVLAGGISRGRAELADRGYPEEEGLPRVSRFPVSSGSSQPAMNDGTR